jgi:hypothetical protein
MPARAVDAALAALCAVDRDGVLTVDLSGLEWVPPSAIVATIAQAARARAVGRDFAVRGPAGELSSYAARMRLGRMLDALGVHHDLPHRRERDQSEHLLELREIDSGDAADRLAALVYRKTRSLDAALAKALHQSVGEIADNVPDHAASLGFLVAQTLPRRRQLWLAVGDAGVGMYATLAARGARDDEDAIVLATKERVSRFDDPDRGFGLPTALRLIKGRGGSVYIASGTASVRHFPRTRRFLSSPSAYPGTLVEARIALE